MGELESKKREEEVKRRGGERDERSGERERERAINDGRTSGRE